MKREEACDVLASLADDVLEAVAVVVETAECLGDWYNDADGNERWHNDSERTLQELALDIRELKA